MRCGIKRSFQSASSGFIAILVLLSFAEEAGAAACCGGGVALPALITGDDRAQVTASYGQSEIKTDVGADSLWRRRRAGETYETLKLEGAHIFRDRWQAGVAVPVVRRSRTEDSHSGLGDLTGVGAYEFLTDWDYHPWRPRGHVFVQLTLPTGESIHDTDSDLAATGEGFITPSVGVVFSKIFGPWDTHLTASVRRPLARDFSTSTARGRLEPGFGTTVSVGGGYNSGPFRLGGTVTSDYEDAMRITGETSSEGSPERFVTATILASYLFSESRSLTVAYKDQALLGSPVNTSLGSGVSVYFQKRWPR